MLHAPTSENKTKNEANNSHSQPVAEQEHRLHPPSFGQSGLSSWGRGLGNNRQENLQKTLGNQAALRMNGAVLQRKCACDNSLSSSGNCSKCQQKEEMLLQRRAKGEEEASEVPPIVHEVINSSGQPLEPETRAFMEPHFQHDFSHVRVHTNAKAAESAKAVKALAYTVGNNVVFSTNQYTPNNIVGKRLLAHELTHVVQQKGALSSTKLSIGSPNTQQEREADEMAKATITNQSKQVDQLPSVSHSLQRESEFEEDVQEVSIESNSEDVDVQDGDSPSGDTVSVGYLSDTQIATEDEFSSSLKEINELGDEDLSNTFIDSTVTEMEAKTVNNKAKSAPKKNDKPKEVRWIKNIDIDLTRQKITLEWSDGQKETSTTSTGKGCPNTGSDPCPKDTNNQLCTPTGNFSVGKKGEADYKNTQGAAMSWYVEFVAERGIGIHNSQFVNEENPVPLSHGCVRVPKNIAKKVNQNIKNTTKISVDGKAKTKPWKKTDAHKNGYTDCPDQPPEKPKKSIDKPSQTTSGRTKYTVQKGDTLSEIAKKFGTTIDHLKELNKDIKSNIIKIGQSLVVPEPSK